MKREKILAIGGVAFLAMLAVYSIGSYVTAEFRRRGSTETRIREDIRRIQAKIHQGQSAKRTLQTLQERALPAGKRIDESHTRYQQWLLSQVTGSGLADAVVQAQSLRRDTKLDGSYVLIYHVSAKGSPAQLVAWWKEFYGLEFMHSLHNITLTPIEGTDLLRIDATVQVYAMANAAEQEMANLPRRPAEKFQEYADAITKRRIFSTANRAPTLELPKVSSVRRGAEISLQATAKDADPGDKLVFSLVDAPSGATINPESGQVQWPAPPEGTHNITVQVQDSGSPPLASTATVAVTVGRSLVQFDDAKQAFFCGLTSNEQKTQAWLQVRTTGALLLLEVGDELNVGTIVGTVARIDDRSLELNLGDRQVTVNLGDSLAKLLPE